MMIRLKHFARKKITIVAVVVAIIILIAMAVCYFIVSKSESAAKTSLAYSKNKTTTELVSLNKKLADANTSKVKRRAAFENYITMLSKVKNGAICPQKSLFYYQILQSKTSCEEKTKKLHDYEAKLHNLHHYLLDEAALAGIVVPFTKDGATFGEQQAYWKQLSDKVQAHVVGGDAKPLRMALTKSLLDYSDVWGSLVAADTAKNKTAFEEAEKQLEVQHQALGEIHAIDEVKLGELQKAAQVAYAHYLQ